MIIKPTKKVIALLIVLLISAACVVISLDKYIASPYPSSVETQGISSQNYCDDHGIIIDNSNKRILFLDNNKEIFHIKEASLLDSPVCLYTYSLCDENYSYVTKYYFDNNSSCISKEVVDKYSKFGQKIETVFKMEYDLNCERLFSPRISCISGDSDYLYISVIDSDGKGIEIDKVSKKSNECQVIENVTLGPEVQSFVVCQYFHEFDEIAAIDSNRQLFVFSNQATNFTKSEYVDNFAASFDVIRNNDGTYKLQSFEDNEGKIFLYSMFMIVRLLLFWIGLTILIIFTVVAITKWVIRCLKNNEFSGLKKCLIAAMVILISSIIVGYYSQAINSKALRDMESSISSISATLSYSQQEELINCIQEYDTNGKLSEATYEEMWEFLYEAQKRIDDNSSNMTFYLNHVDDKNSTILVDSARCVISGAVIDNSSLEFIHSDKETKVITTATSWGDYVSAKTPVIFQDNIIGSFTVVCSTTVFKSQTLKECMGLLIALISIIATMSFIILEVGKLVKSFHTRKKWKNKGQKHPEIAMCRSLYYFGIMVCSFDSALVTLIAKDMLAGTQFDNLPLILSLPLASISIGWLVGVPIASKVFSRVNVRPGMILGLSVIIFGYCISAFAVYMNNFIMLLVGLFVANIFCIVVNILILNMPLALNNSTVRSELNREISAAKISGSSTALLIAGFLVGKFGNTSVYIAAIAASIIFIVFVTFVIPRKTSLRHIFTTETKNKSSEIKNIKRYLLNPSIFALIFFVMLITSFASGYKTFLFPLISYDASVSKTLISDVIVLVNAIIFFTIPTAVSLEKKIGNVNMIIVIIVIMGFAFLSMNINSTMMWSIVVLFLVSLAPGLLDPTNMNYWQSFIEKHNYPKAIGQKVSNFTINFLAAVRNPILGCFLNLGYTVCCTILGVYALVSSLLFGLAVKKDSKKK